MKLDPDSIYVLGNAFDWPTCYVSGVSSRSWGRLGECPSSKYYDNVPSCPNFRILHGMELLTPPDYRDLYALSKRDADLFWFPGAVIIKEKHVEALSKYGFTGIQFRPVNLYKNSKCKERLEGYVELFITGKVRIDLEKSKMKVLFDCPVCGAVRRSHWGRSSGLHFEGSIEDWPDVFVMDPERTSHRFVKARFAQALIDLNLQPFSLSRFEELSTFLAEKW